MMQDVTIVTAGSVLVVNPDRQTFARYRRMDEGRPFDVMLRRLDKYGRLDSITFKNGCVKITATVMIDNRVHDYEYESSPVLRVLSGQINELDMPDGVTWVNENPRHLSRIPGAEDFRRVEDRLTLHKYNYNNSDRIVVA